VKYLMFPNLCSWGDLLFQLDLWRKIKLYDKINQNGLFLFQSIVDLSLVKSLLYAKLLQIDLGNLTNEIFFSLFFFISGSRDIFTNFSTVLKQLYSQFKIQIIFWIHTPGNWKKMPWNRENRLKRLTWKFKHSSRTLSWRGSWLGQDQGLKKKERAEKHKLNQMEKGVAWI